MLSPVNVSMESLNLMTLVPMLIPIIGALLILVVDMFKSGQDKSMFVMLILLVFGITKNIYIAKNIKMFYLLAI